MVLCAELLTEAHGSAVIASLVSCTLPLNGLLHHDAKVRSVKARRVHVDESGLSRPPSKRTSQPSKAAHACKLQPPHSVDSICQSLRSLCTRFSPVFIVARAGHAEQSVPATRPGRRGYAAKSGFRRLAPSVGSSYSSTFAARLAAMSSAVRQSADLHMLAPRGRRLEPPPPVTCEIMVSSLQAAQRSAAADVGAGSATRFPMAGQRSFADAVAATGARRPRISHFCCSARPVNIASCIPKRLLTY